MLFDKVSHTRNRPSCVEFGTHYTNYTIHLRGIPMELKVTAFANVVCIVGIVGLIIANI